MKKVLLGMVGFCEEAVLGTRRLPEWEDFKGTRLCRQWEREAELCLRPAPRDTLSIVTHDELYELKTDIAVAAGWGANYRTDNPYSDNEYAMFLTTKDKAVMRRNLIETAVRYRYEVTRYGEPLADWTPWTRGARKTRTDTLPAFRTNQLRPANQVAMPQLALADEMELEAAEPETASAYSLQAAPELSLTAKKKARG